VTAIGIVIGMTSSLVILSKLEQEYLLRAIESALHVDEARHFFLWMQGQFQALLPHRVMVAMRLGADGELLQIECLHGTVLGASALASLCDPRDGLAPRLARHCRSGVHLPSMLEAEGEPLRGHPLRQFQAELRRQGWRNLMVHGSGPMPGGASFFALLCMPQKPGARHAYFFELLLPYLHMALSRLPHGASADAAAAPMAAERRSTERPLSAREAQVLACLVEGRSNDEIAAIIGISALTVKNHLQRLYRLLGVSNRTHAVSRGISMRLLERHPAGQAGSAGNEIRRGVP
jgi:transcriptional regulator EpsA